MKEIACEDNGQCDVDQRSFKAYLARWMGYTANIAPWTRESLDPYLKTSAMAAVAQCNAGPNQTSCGLKWTDNGVNDGNLGVGQEMAAMEVVQALLYSTASGPVTQKSGGISPPDNNAGSAAPVKMITFNPITTGDRAGASILTLLVLVSIVAGAWWMVA